MKSRHLRVTFYEALAMKEDEKEQSCAVCHHYRDSDYQVSKEVFSNPKIPLVPDKARKVTEVEDYKGDHNVALFFAEERGIVTH